MPKRSTFNQHILEATWDNGLNNPSLLNVIIAPNDTTIDNLELEKAIILYFSSTWSVELSSLHIPVTQERNYFDKADYDSINSKLWAPLLRPELDLDTQCKNFKTCINNIIKKYVPKSTVIVNEARARLTPAIPE